MAPKVRFMRSIWFVNMHLVCVLLISCGDDETANLPGGGPNDGTSSEAVGFTTADGINISAVLRIPEGLIEATPAVILIHSEETDKSEWVGSSFSNTLIDENFIFLAYDIRSYGSSESDEGDQEDLLIDPGRAYQDLEAAVLFLRSNPQVNLNRIGVLGTQLGASLACVGSGDQQLIIKTAVVLSPSLASVQGISSNIFNFQMESILYIASEQAASGQEAQDAQQLFDQTLEPSELAVIPNTSASGTDIFARQPALQQDVVEWFKQELKN